MPLIAYIDTETSHISPKQGQFLTLACALIDEATLELVAIHETSVLKVDPWAVISPKALEVNGIKEEAIRNGADRAEAMKAWVAWLDERRQGAKIIWGGHNCKFDIGFVEPDLEAIDRHFSDLFEYHGDYDTSTLAREHLVRRGKFDSVGLAKVAAHLGYADHKQHTAIGDVEAGLYVLRKLLRP